ncbi:hypothetical protein IDM40_06070 [Nocardiopsis sp. HNM0947]|uniref:Uncharacterized protein n=1 Tax=Nocardiopsis coralli TaxID=2772213 RepID=A0ABR9P391_9ACTN|nr:hypothetical protein [Nocardiopsis coralli]MBE2998272.1 hypothetical protein [Nocardiopsis coralli]
MSDHEKKPYRGKLPPGGIPIPPHEVLKLQERAKRYVESAKHLYANLRLEESDPALVEEYNRERDRQAEILKTGQWMDDGVSERIVEEYPPLLRELRGRLADLDS